MGGAFEKQVNMALQGAGYPLVRGAAKVPEANSTASLPPIRNWRSTPPPFVVARKSMTGEHRRPSC